MKTIIITVFLIGAVFANPISYESTVSESSEFDSHPAQGLSVSQSSENDTAEIQSSEENTSSQSQEPESSESSESSEDKTSEESDSQSDEDDSNPMGETRDDSMGSEENVRKNLAELVPDSTSSEESTEAPPVNPTTTSSSSSSESDSNETDETSESSESSEMGQIHTRDCGNATESCESEEYFFQGIGDDGQFSVGNLLAPDESERELHLKR